MSTLERAIAIAAEAHAGQSDKAGAPYILHPLRVMLRVDGLAARIAAVLHDVVEDSEWTLNDLRTEGFSEDVLRAIDAVSRREGEDYMAFCRRAGDDSVARCVKLADLEDNMDLSRIQDPSEKDRERVSRYREAHAMLVGRA